MLYIFRFCCVRHINIYWCYISLLLAQNSLSYCSTTKSYQDHILDIQSCIALWRHSQGFKKGNVIHGNLWTVTKSCPTLCISMDCSPPGSSVHRISLARLLEWVAISFSRGSSWPRDWTCVSCIGRRFGNSLLPSHQGSPAHILLLFLLLSVRKIELHVSIPNSKVTSLKYTLLLIFLNL